MNDQRDLQGEARKLLQRMNELPPREPGEKLRPIEELRIVQLAQEGVTQEAIAATVGCHQSTVSRTIAEYTDTRPLARKRLEAKALEMAERIITDGKPETLLKVMAKLDVVRDENVRTADSGVIIQIGLAGSPVVTPDGAKVPLDTDRREVSPGVFATSFLSPRVPRDAPGSLSADG